MQGEKVVCQLHSSRAQHRGTGAAACMRRSSSKRSTSKLSKRRYQPTSLLCALFRCAAACVFCIGCGASVLHGISSLINPHPLGDMSQGLVGEWGLCIAFSCSWAALEAVMVVHFAHRVEACFRIGSRLGFESLLALRTAPPYACLPAVLLASGLLEFYSLTVAYRSIQASAQASSRCCFAAMAWRFAEPQGTKER